MQVTSTGAHLNTHNITVEKYTHLPQIHEVVTRSQNLRSAEGPQDIRGPTLDNDVIWLLQSWFVNFLHGNTEWFVIDYCTHLR